MRAYRMSKRLDDVAETRLRIVEATVELHGTVGPAHASIAAIAERAGVSRVTVYRHFPDADVLFAACSAHWYADQPRRPDPEAWQAISDPEERVRRGLTDLYRFFRHGQSMLARVYRDYEALPPSRQQAVGQQNAFLRDALFAAFPRPTKRLRAVVAHATAFPTWRSLCLDNGLTDKEAVEVMLTLVSETSHVPSR